MISKLFKKIFKINKTAKVAAILIFATTILSIMNLIVCRREHLEEVKNFLQVNFHISFLEDKDASGSLSKKGYELYPEWNCEIYALNDEKVIYYPEALYIPVSGTYDIPGFEYGYMEYKGNNKEIIKMIKKTCLWFKQYREYKGLDYLSFHKRVYYSLDEAVHNDPNIDMVIDSGDDIKEILEPEIPKPEMTLKDVSIFGPYNILITKKANKRQRLIALRINSDIPDYICPFFVSIYDAFVLDGAEDLLTLYEDKNTEFIEKVRSRLKARSVDGEFYGDITSNPLIFNLRINGRAPDGIEKIDYNKEEIYFWYYSNLVLGTDADSADISIN